MLGGVAHKTRKQLGLPPLPRGKPRADGKPPIQRRLGEAQAETEPQRIAAIRHQAGLGVPEDCIAVLVGVPVETLKPGGKYYEECLKGRGQAILAMSSKVYDRCMEGRPADALEWLQHNAEWRKPARDVVRKPASDEPDGFELELVDAEPPKKGKG